MFVISLFVPLKLVPAEAENDRKLHDAFFNSFRPEFKQII